MNHTRGGREGSRLGDSDAVRFCPSVGARPPTRAYDVPRRPRASPLAPGVTRPCAPWRRSTSPGCMRIHLSTTRGFSRARARLRCQGAGHRARPNCISIAKTRRRPQTCAARISPAAATVPDASSRPPARCLTYGYLFITFREQGAPGGSRLRRRERGRGARAGAVAGPVLARHREGTW